jgi:hypothetical protein
MKKLLTLTLAGLALALPATALADTWGCFAWGASPSSRTVTGSCITRKLVTKALLMHCDGVGVAIARYDFTMPGSWHGTPALTLDATDGVRHSLIRLDDSHVRVIVRTSGRSTVVVASVSVGFYR